MTAIQLYIYNISPPCRSVFMTAKALDVPLELKYLDFDNREHLRPEFLKINPLHKVPVIQDGDFILSESRAIMRYLVGKYGGEDNSLYPRDLNKRALIDRLLDHDLGVFYRSMLEDIMFPIRRREVPTAEQEQKIIKAFDWLNTEVKGKKFITGDDLTIADFALVVGFAASVAKTGMDKFPHAMEWYQRMKALPYYKEVNQPFYDVIKMLQSAKEKKPE